MCLPADVFALIVAQVDTGDNKTLRSLCLTNRFLGWEATKRLYRELDDTPSRASIHCKLLTTLISHPDLAAIVRSYGLRNISREAWHTEDELYKLIAAKGEDDDPMDPLEELITILLSKALPLMVNLKEFTFSDRLQKPEASALLISADFQLEKLEWGNGWDGAFLDFLERQRALKWIKIHPSDSNLQACNIAHPIPPLPWQNLTTLAGPQAVVEAILPFAPGVRNLELHFTGRYHYQSITSIFDLSRDIAKCLGQLTRLTFQNYYTDISVTALEGAVDNLEYLAVGCLMYGSVSFPSPSLRESRMADKLWSTAQNAQVSTFVSRLKKLKMFVLLSANTDSVVSCRALAVDMLRESESLEQVIMDSMLRYLAPGSPQMGYFLLSRGSEELRRLRWDTTHLNRFMLPACEEDTTRWVYIIFMPNT